MPVERTDLLELVTQQDKIANRAKDIAGRVIGRELVIPDSLQVSFMAYVKRCIDATGQASITVNEFDALLESGFRGREVDLVESLVNEIDSIEADTDKLQIALRKELKGIEGDMNPVDVMFLYNIIDWIGDLADLKVIDLSGNAISGTIPESLSKIIFLQYKDFQPRPPVPPHC